MSSLNWSDTDRMAVDTARLLAADAVQNAGHGHPGTAMSLAPVAYYLYQNALTHDPNDTGDPLEPLAGATKENDPLRTVRSEPVSRASWVSSSQSVWAAWLT